MVSSWMVIMDGVIMDGHHGWGIMDGVIMDGGSSWMTPSMMTPSAVYNTPTSSVVLDPTGSSLWHAMGYGKHSLLKRQPSA